MYDPQDYPADLRELFQIEWDFPSVEPPQYLLELKPELYEQEKARIAARFEEAVRLAEEAFTAEFAKLVAHLRERLSGSDDGRPKVFRDSAVENLKEFFGRFGDLSVRSNAQLEELVESANRLVDGVGAQDLRASAHLREHVQRQLGAVQSALDGLLVDRPRRRILRGHAQEAT